MQMSQSGRLRSGAIVVDLGGIELAEVLPTDDRLGRWAASAIICQTKKALQAAAALVESEDDDVLLELSDGRVGRCNWRYDGSRNFQLVGADELRYPEPR